MKKGQTMNTAKFTVNYVTPPSGVTPEQICRIFFGTSIAQLARKIATDRSYPQRVIEAGRTDV